MSGRHPGTGKRIAIAEPETKGPEAHNKKQAQNTKKQEQPTKTNKPEPNNQGEPKGNQGEQKMWVSVCGVGGSLAAIYPRFGWSAFPLHMLTLGLVWEPS